MGMSTHVVYVIVLTLYGAAKTVWYYCVLRIHDYDVHFGRNVRHPRWLYFLLRNDQHLHSTHVYRAHCFHVTLM